MRNENLALCNYDSWTFSPDVVFPEKSMKDEIEKHRSMVIREFSERMLYWVLPYFTIALMIIAHCQVYGLVGFSIVSAILLFSGIIINRARRNRRLIHLLGFSSYATIILCAVYSFV